MSQYPENFEFVTEGEQFIAYFPHAEQKLPQNHPCGPTEYDIVDYGTRPTGEVDANGNPIYESYPICADDAPVATTQPSPPTTPKPTPTTNPNTGTTSPPETSKPPVSTNPPPSTEAPIIYFDEDADAIAVAVRLDKDGTPVFLEGSDIDDKSAGLENGALIAAERGIDIASNPYAARIVREVNPDKWIEYGLVPPTTTTSEVPVTTTTEAATTTTTEQPATTATSTTELEVITTTTEEEETTTIEEEVVETTNVTTTTELVVVVDETMPPTSEAVILVTEKDPSSSDGTSFSDVLVPTGATVGVLVVVAAVVRRMRQGTRRRHSAHA